MRGFVLGLFTSVGVVLLSGQFQLTPSATHRTASAGQPQETVSEATSQDPTPAADPRALEPQIARELLNLRRQLGNGWRSDVNGEGAFLKALEQVARDDTTAVSEPNAGPERPLADNRDPREQTTSKLRAACRSMQELARQLRVEGKATEAERLLALRTLLRWEADRWAPEGPPTVNHSKDTTR